MQINMAKELDDIWGSVSGTSFQGRIEAGINAAGGNMYPAMREGGKAAAQKIRGVNEKNAYKAIMRFLNEQN